MSTIRDRSRVELAGEVAGLNPGLLTGDALAPVRDALAAFDAAQEAVAAAHEAVAEAEGAVAIRDAEIRQAVRDGEPAPRAISGAEADEMIREATRQLMGALRDAKAAGDVFEASVVEHRVAIRAVLLDTFGPLHADAIDAQRRADALRAKRGSIVGTLNAVDVFAAKAEDAAQANGTKRHEYALEDVRRRLFGEYHRGAADRSPLAGLTDFPVDALGADALAENEFLVARRGEGAVQERRQVEADLHALRAGDVVIDVTTKRKRITALEDRLAGLLGRP